MSVFAYGVRAVFAQYSAYQWDRSFFFRSENLTKKLAGAKVEDYFESDIDAFRELLKFTPNCLVNYKKG